MKLTTPAVWTFQQQGTQDNGWADHYGALHIAAQYAGLEMPARFVMPALWQHGVVPPWAKRQPTTLVFNLEPSTSGPFLVAREDERETLLKNGYADVRAIGLPMLYVATPIQPRTNNSLLVVPTHTLLGATYPERAAFEAYADEIAKVAKGFGEVVICIHPNCRKNGLWVNEFSSRGFQIVYGAQTNDRNALVRMKALFEQFEYVTTNGWGSHVPYALASGAKVSIFGTEPMVRAENLLQDGTWSKNVAALKGMFSREVLAEREKFTATFRVQPRKGVQDVKLGRWFLGAKNQLTPEKMRALLVELITPAPAAIDPAVDASMRAFQHNPADLNNCFALASRAMRTQRLVEALSLFDHAVALAPQQSPVHLGRGITLALLNEFTEAESALRRSWQLKPDSVEALRFLAQLCRSRGRIEEAIQFYERLLVLSPDDGEALEAVNAMLSASVKVG